MQLITEHMLEIESCADVVSKLGHERGVLLSPRFWLPPHRQLERRKINQGAWLDSHQTDHDLRSRWSTLTAISAVVQDQTPATFHSTYHATLEALLVGAVVGAAGWAAVLAPLRKEIHPVGFGWHPQKPVLVEGPFPQILAREILQQLPTQELPAPR